MVKNKQHIKICGINSHTNISFEENVEEEKHGQFEIIFILMTNTNKKINNKKLKHGIFSKRGRLKLKIHRRKRKNDSYMELKQILRFCLNCPL